MKNFSTIVLASLAIAGVVSVLLTWKNKSNGEFFIWVPDGAFEIMMNFSASGRNIPVACGDGECNWQVRVVAVSPAGSDWHFDISRNARDEVIGESFFSSDSHQVGVWYDFPVTHAAILQFLGEVEMDPASMPVSSGGIIIEVARPIGVVTTYLLSSSTLNPKSGVTLNGVCPPFSEVELCDAGSRPRNSK